MSVDRHAEVVEAEDGSGLVEDTHDALLTPDGGGGGHPDVDFLAIDRGRQLAVLGTTTLDDVHTRHDLDATDQSESHRRRKDEDLFQGAVDTEPHPDDLVGWLNVHVGGAVTHGLHEDAIDNLYHGSIVRDDHGGGRLNHPLA